MKPSRKDKKHTNQAGIYGLQIQKSVGTAGKEEAGELLKNGILILLCAVVTLGCLLDLIQPQYQKGALWCLTVLSGSMITLLFLPKARWKGILRVTYLLLFGLLLWHYKDWVADGFLYTANHMIKLVNEYFELGLDAFEVSREEPKAVTVFLLFLMQIFMGMFAAAVWKPSLRALGRAVLLFAMSVGLVVGLVPSYWAMGGAAMAFFLLLLPEQKWKAVAVPAVAWLVLLLLANRIISEEYYAENIKDTEQKQRVLDVYEAINTSSFWDGVADQLEEFKEKQEERWSGLFEDSDSGSSGGNGINGGAFSNSGKVSFDNVTVLKVTVPRVNQSIYLKGFVGATYTTTGWEGLDKEAEKAYKAIKKKYQQNAQDLSQRYLRMLFEQKSKGENLAFAVYDGTTSALLSLRRINMSVDYVTAGTEYRYAPYFWEAERNGNGSYVQDLYVEPEKRATSYTYTLFLSDMKKALELDSEFTGELLRSHPGWSDFSAFERAYRSYVYDTYTQLPEGHEELRELDLASMDATLPQKLKAVISYLSDYQYTLSPGKLPAGEDFVDYFLFKNKKGYCVHFASSAVLLLRDMGVPARYAEGYLITSADIGSAPLVGRTVIGGFDGIYYKEEDVQQKMVEVKDYSGHAWIEVYFDGFGWIPIEVTYGGSGTATELPEEITEAVEALPTPTPLPTNTPLPTRVPTPTVAEIVTPIPKLTPTEAPDLTDIPSPVPEPGSDEAEICPTGQVTSGASSRENEEQSEKQWMEEEHKRTFSEWVNSLTKGQRLALRCLSVILAGLLLLALIAALLFLRYKLIWQLRARSNRSRRYRVLWYYRCFERLLAEYGLKHDAAESYQDFLKRVMQQCPDIPEYFPKIMELALRAGFSKERLSDEEIEQVWTAYQEMRQLFYEKRSKLYILYCKFVKLY